MHDRRHRKRRIQRLRALIPLAATCNAKELRELDTIGVETEVAEGRELFIVFEGITVVQQDGCPLGVVGPGSIIGEMALVAGTPRTATVVAATSMRLLVLTQAESVTSRRSRRPSPQACDTWPRFAVRRTPCFSCTSRG